MDSGTVEITSDTQVVLSENAVADTAIASATERYTQLGDEDDNKVQLIGKIVEFGSGFEIEKERYTEKFHEFKLSVERISGICDTIPVVCSEKLMFDTPAQVNDEVVVIGKLHSRSIPITVKRQDENGAEVEVPRSKTIIFCHATDLILLKDSDIEVTAEERNVVELTGYICRPVRLRTTVKSGRQIADVVIAVKRPYYRRKDYIACIAWGRNAVLASNREVGDDVKILGRLQSREKYKKDAALPILLHEVSITDLTVLTGEAETETVEVVSEE